jgi:predicted metal-dependent phosphoesterase TrpH
VQDLLSATDISPAAVEVFREMNEHLRATENKHLQLSAGYLGATAVALSFLAQQTGSNSDRTLLHSWSHSFAYLVIVLIGCTTMWAQHIYRGWKKHYLLSCKMIVETWDIPDEQKVLWLRPSVGPYSHPLPGKRAPASGRLLKVSGENGLYYFTLAITSCVLAVLLYSAVQLVSGQGGIWIAASLGAFYIAFVTYISFDGWGRRNMLETEWYRFRHEHDAAKHAKHAKQRIQDTSKRNAKELSRPFSARQKAWLRRSLGKAAGTEPTLLVDLHNHTWWSDDASNRFDDYERAHKAGCFDVLAITDHNSIDGALEVQARADFQVIIGEEIDTSQGELVGLFLRNAIEDGQSAKATADAIRAQEGLVYLQHPRYKFVRNAMALDTIDALLEASLIDIIEIGNAGAFMGHANRAAKRLRKTHSRLVAGAGSDAHHPRDIGRCVVAIPGSIVGELTADDLRARLPKGYVIDCHRPAVATLCARGSYAIASAIGQLRGEDKQPRSPRFHLRQ